MPTGLLPTDDDELIDARNQAEEETAELEQQVKKEEARARASAANKTGVRCRDCGYINRIGDFFCVECGGDISAQPRVESPADVTQQMKALNMGDIRAALAQQEAEAAAQALAAKEETKPKEIVTKPISTDSDFPEGSFQFTEAMFLRFTDVASGRYTEIVPTHNKPLLIGRSHKSLPMQPDVDLTPFLHEQHGVSRRHALIRWRDVRLEIQDLNSTNGTGINGFRFRPKATHEVRNCDIITLGRVKIKVLFMTKDTGPIGKVTDRLDD